MTATDTITETRLLTADDLLRLHGQGVRGELIRGVLELEETMVSGYTHGKIVMSLGATLFNFVKPRSLGTLVAADSGVWLERDPDTVRGPDIAFTSAERIPLDADIPGYSEVVPDLVVEVRSPSDSRREVHDKARMWLSHGVRLVWVVPPPTPAPSTSTAPTEQRRPSPETTSLTAPTCCRRSPAPSQRSSARRRPRRRSRPAAQMGLRSLLSIVICLWRYGCTVY